MLLNLVNTGEYTFRLFLLIDRFYTIFSFIYLLLSFALCLSLPRLTPATQATR